MAGLDGQQELQFVGRMGLQGIKVATEAVKFGGSTLVAPFLMLDHMLHMATASREDRRLAKELFLQKLGLYEKLNPMARSMQEHLKKDGVMPDTRFIADKRSYDLLVEKAKLYGLDFYGRNLIADKLWAVITTTDQAELLNRALLAVDREVVCGMVTYGDLSSLSEKGVSPYAMVVSAEEALLFSKYAEEAGLRVACLPGHQNEDGQTSTKLLFDAENKPEIEAIHTIIQNDLAGKHGDLLKEQIAHIENTNERIMNLACSSDKYIKGTLYVVNSRGDYMEINNKMITFRVDGVHVNDENKLPRPMHLKDSNAIIATQDKVNYALLRMGNATILSRRDFNELQRLKQEAQSQNITEDAKKAIEKDIERLLARHSESSREFTVRDLMVLQQHAKEREEIIAKMDVPEALKSALAASSIERLPGMRDAISRELTAVNQLSRVEAMIMHEKAEALGVWSDVLEMKDGSYSIAFRPADTEHIQDIMSETIYETSGVGGKFLAERLKYEDEIRETALKDAMDPDLHKSLYFVVNGNKDVIVDKDGVTIRNDGRQIRVQRDNSLFQRTMEKALGTGGIVRLSPSEYRQYNSLNRETETRGEALKILRNADREQGCPVLSGAAKEEYDRQQLARELYGRKLAQDNPTQEKLSYSYLNDRVGMVEFKELEGENKRTEDERREEPQLTRNKELEAELQFRLNKMQDQMGNITTQDGKLIEDRLDITEKVDESVNQPERREDDQEPSSRVSEPEYVPVDLKELENEERVFGDEEPERRQEDRSREDEERNDDLVPGENETPGGNEMPGNDEAPDLDDEPIPLPIPDEEELGD